MYPGDLEIPQPGWLIDCSCLASDGFVYMISRSSLEFDTDDIGPSLIAFYHAQIFNPLVVLGVHTLYKQPIEFFFFAALHKPFNDTLYIFL